MAHGATRGERRRRPKYVRGSGLPWAISAELSPTSADKLLDLCEAANLSAAALIDTLIERTKVDTTTGLPETWDSMPYQKELRIAG